MSSLTVVAGPGLRLSNWDWSPAKQAFVSSSQDYPDLLRDVMSNTWTEFSPKAWTALTTELQKSDRFAKGVSARNVTGHLGANPELSTAIVDGNLVLSVRVPDNYLQLYVTTPDIPVLGFGVDRAADPKYELFFDVNLTFVLPLSGELRPLQFERVEGSIKINKVDSQNLTGDLSLGLVDVITSAVKMAGGPDYWLKAKNAAEQTFDLTKLANQNLKAVNQRIAALQAKGFTLMRLLEAFDPNGNQPTTYLQNDVFSLEAYREKYGVPLVGPGVLRGTIHWDKSLGQPTGRNLFARSAVSLALSELVVVPTTPAAAPAPKSTTPALKRTAAATNLPAHTITRFNFLAEIEVAPGSPGSFGRPTTQLQRSAEYHVTETETGYDCSYIVRDLPLDVPLRLGRLSVLPGTDWAALNPQPLPPKEIVAIARGWAGILSITPPRFVADKIRATETSSVSKAAVSAAGSKSSSAVAQVKTSNSAHVAAVSSPRATATPVAVKDSALHLEKRAANVTALELVCQNPTAAGTLAGIDFDLSLQTPMVIH